MTKPKSETLFHFTKDSVNFKGIDNLKSILLNGLYPRYCLEHVDWFGIKEHKIAYPMVCFCDIPLSRISEHTEVYGSHGIGLTKNWGIKNKVNPVIYSFHDGTVASLANDYFKLIENKLNDLKNQNNLTDSIQFKTKVEVNNIAKDFFRLFKLIKPLTGKMDRDGIEKDKEFYQENEWRYTPETKHHVEIFKNKEDFNNKKEALNQDAERFRLQLSPEDIMYLFVKEDSEIPSLVDFILKELNQYSSDDRKILISRIISLKTIMSDV